MPALREPCTGVSAMWCHNCGDCTCYRNLVVEPGTGQVWDDHILLEDPRCPLHGERSQHCEYPSCYQCGALFTSVADRDEHELAC